MKRTDLSVNIQTSTATIKIIPDRGSVISRRSALPRNRSAAAVDCVINPRRASFSRPRSTRIRMIHKSSLASIGFRNKNASFNASGFAPSSNIRIRFYHCWKVRLVLSYFFHAETAIGGNF